jgi:iron(II)-dependent oxidoreductase
MILGAALVVAGLGIAARSAFRRDAPSDPQQPVQRRPEPVKPANADDPDSLIAQMLAQGRYALLLRPQVAEDLETNQFETTVEVLQTSMALVPDGSVILGEAGDPSADAQEGDGGWQQRQRAVRVASYFLDRHPVTNRQYYEFVASGGYEQIAFWDTAIWPAVLDFVDQTHEPGPRFWSHGYCAPGEEDHPVVGISWYEAAAYARWAGKRLPTDAEWAKAGAWPVKLSETQSSQRRFPWGEAMDRTKANLWGSGPGTTIPVTELPDGVSVGGIYQLIGNVWEWTRSDYVPGCFPPEEFISESPLKSIRGGAFDTYFDNQATCQFQSGDVQMARQRNIGFRCALSVCDLMLSRESSPESRDEEVPEEVNA